MPPRSLARSPPCSPTGAAVRMGRAAWPRGIRSRRPGPGSYFFFSLRLLLVAQRRHRRRAEVVARDLGRVEARRRHVLELRIGDLAQRVLPARRLERRQRAVGRAAPLKAWRAAHLPVPVVVADERRLRRQRRTSIVVRDVAGEGVARARLLELEAAALVVAADVAGE